MNRIDPVAIRGTGSALPSRAITNQHFCKYLSTTNEWIVTRTGIRERRFCTENESTLTLAAAASRAALQNADMDASELDFILVCTVTPELPIPSTSCLLQKELGIDNVPAMDINAACSGYVYGIHLASALLAGGAYRNILVVGAETLHRITDQEDRATCVLFADGAGAVILSRAQKDGQGILYSKIGASGEGGHLIFIPAGGSREPACPRTVNERLHFMRMKGREVYKFAVVKMQEVIEETLRATGTAPQDVALFIPHQSNLRIIDSAREKLGLSPERVLVNIDRYGNTSSASIAIGLDEARRSGRVKSGDLVLIVAFGAGLTWGSLLLRL